MKKICKKAAASLLSAVMVCGMATVLPATVSLAVEAPPAWKPTDAQTAVDFLNEHGSTYVSDNYVAFCFPVYPDSADGGGTAVILDGSADYSLVQDTTLRYSCPYEFSETEEPDYDQYPGKERYEVEHAYREWLAAHRQAYQLYIWEIGTEGTFSFRLQRDNQMPDTGHVYSFERTAAGVLIETDLFGWMPDSAAEFQNYIQDNGGISAHDNYLICAGIVNYSTGAEMNITTEGSGKIGEFRYSGCSPIILGEQPTGNASYVFQFAEAKKAGDLNVRMDINIPWAPEEAKKTAETRQFVIKGNLTIVDYQEPFIIPHYVPDWMPSSYEEAQQFSDTYGKTLIKDGYVCLCIPYRCYQDEQYVLLNNFQTGKLDPNTVKASEISTLSEMRYPRETNVDGLNEGYYVHLFQAIGEGLIDLSFCKRTGEMRTDIPPTDTEIWNLTFEVTNKDITETDIYGWLPDCSTEFDAWLEENGALTAHGKYLVSAGQVPICPVEVSFQTFGEAKVQEIGVDSCGHVFLQAPGTAENSLKVYVATMPGSLTVRRSLKYQDGYLENGKTEEQITYGYYEVDDALMIRPLDIMNGDISGDGMLNIADAVGMTEFLFCQLQLDTEQMIKADYNHDTRVNAIDLTLMKRDILSGGGQVLRPPV